MKKNKKKTSNKSPFGPIITEAATRLDSLFSNNFDMLIKDARGFPPPSRRIVAVSGAFDPVHIGHVRMFNEAKLLGEYLIVIVNNDNWLRQKKGYVFMPERERKEIIESLRAVDAVMLTNHTRGTKDLSVCTELEQLKPDVFANGGDRNAENIPEYALCNKYKIEMVFGVGAGGKIQSSTELVKRASDNPVSSFHMIGRDSRIRNAQ